MNRTLVKIAYGGEAVDNGVMDVRQLAPALLALGALFEEANKELNGESVKLQVLVRSDFEKGSFQINLELVKSLAETIKNLFDCQKDFSPLNLVTLVLGGGISLIQLIKWLKGRNIEGATTIENGRVKIIAQGGYDSIEVDQNVVRLYKNVSLRENLKQVLEPLKRPGVDYFAVRESNKETIGQINKLEVDYFEIKESIKQDLEPIVNTRRIACSVLSVSFVDDYVWRFSDVDSKFSAKMLDERFINDIQSGSISFSKGDILEMDLTVKQSQDSHGKLITEKEVTKVHRHIKPGKQLHLPFD